MLVQSVGKHQCLEIQRDNNAIEEYLLFEIPHKNDIMVLNDYCIFSQSTTSKYKDCIIIII